MCLQDIKIAKSQETRTTSISCASGATTLVAGVANNRVLIRFAPTTITGAIGNLSIVIQYVGDSNPIGIGHMGGGSGDVELSLEKHSHLVKGPFQVVNNSGYTVPMGISEVLQNVDPESVL